MAAVGPNSDELAMAFEAAAIAEEHAEAEKQAASSTDNPVAASLGKKKNKKKNKVASKIKEKLSNGSSKEPEVAPAAGPSSALQTTQVYDAVKKDIEEKHGANMASKFTPEMAAELLRRMSPPKNEPLPTQARKDMSDYKFWSTQPVARFDQAVEEEGPVEADKAPEDIRAEPYPLPEGYLWDTVELDDETQLREVYELLTNHYVEDNDAAFRFDYSADFFRWALKPPGYVKDWHIGVRVAASRRLVGFISAIPIRVRVRQLEKNSSEVNFLCVHKKLRSKRLAPVLIKEVTRRCHLKGIFQAIYTGGVYLPTPVAQCQYFHRALDIKKLVELGFSGVPRFKTLAGMIRENAVPTRTSTIGLREMEARDAPAVTRLLQTYMSRFELAHVFEEAEVLHNFCSGRGTGEAVHYKRQGQVVWSFVVEDPTTKDMTDFFSFVYLPSTAIKHRRTIEAAYLYYYASTAAFPDSGDPPIWNQASQETVAALQQRLNGLMNDALVIAKTAGFDVFNALTLMDNSLFLHRQKFGEGDGRLNYYLYNWLAKPIDGGSPKTTAEAMLALMHSNQPDEAIAANGSRECGSGVGVVML